MASEKTFTSDELAAFKGEGESPIYVGVNGLVFDVSAAKSFYGPGTGYHCFAGKDATVMLATMKTDPSDPALVGRTVSNLTVEERGTLTHWFDNVFAKKYPVVGRMA